MLSIAFIVLLCFDAYFTFFISLDDPKAENFHVYKTLEIFLMIVTWIVGEILFVDQLGVFSHKTHFFILFMLYTLLLKTAVVMLRKDRKK